MIQSCNRGNFRPGMMSERIRLKNGNKKPEQAKAQ